MSVLEQIAEKLMQGKAPEVKALVQQALDEKEEPGKILNQGLLAGMSVIGERFKKNEVYVPEVLIAARAMKAGMEILQPKLADSGVQPVGTACIGTVKGDLHDIGKNIVITMMQGAGFDVIDLGVDVPAEKFIEAVENGAQIIGMSAILTTTLKEMDAVIRLLEEKGLRDKVKVLVGGASVTEQFASDIGADAYCDDAGEGVFQSKGFMEQKV